MIIRAQQYQSFELQAERTFIQQIALAVSEDDAEEWVFLPDGEDWVQVRDLPFETILNLVEAGVARANRYSLEEGDISVFVSFMFSFAPNFDEYPAIHRILTDEFLDDEERMSRIVEAVTDEEWTEVEGRYDELAWISCETGNE